MSIDLKDIEEAKQRISNVVKHTQLDLSRSCTKWIGTEAYLKSENEQITGSFKLRGASNKILSLSNDEKDKGVIAASAGNHAQGVAYAASMAGAKSVVVMPESTPFVKIDATESYGAKVILHGSVYDESFAHAQTLAEDNGYTFVHPFDDPLVMAGQGTLGLEILEDLPDVDSVIVGVGGGGLAAGVGAAIKAKRPECKVFGVQSENFGGMVDLFKGKKPRSAGAQPTIADGTAVKSPSATMLKNYVADVVDDMVTVSESDIAQAIVFLLERAKTVVEGAGALALAGALKGDWDLGHKCCLVLCGGNIDLNLVAKVIDQGLARGGRLARLSMVVSDRPGVLNHLTRTIAGHGANILEVHHDRLGAHLEIRETHIDILVETRNQEHVDRLNKALEAEGVRFV